MGHLEPAITEDTITDHQETHSAHSVTPKNDG